MLGWASATVVLASSTKRFTNSSSQASSSRICLTTRRFSKPPAPRSVARTTRAMPPRASSRSSTYLPKTWGYIRVSVGPRALERWVERAVPLGRRARRGNPQGSKYRLVLTALAMAVFLSCSRAAWLTTRTVTAYVPQACAADGGAYAEYFAYGDFD